MLKRPRRSRGLALVVAAAAGWGAPLPGRGQVAAPGSGSSPQAAPIERLVIDHLILGASDLSWGIREFTRRTAVEPQQGGRHPTAGTRNALVSLGESTYLEILAPDLSGGSVSEPPEAATPRQLAAVGWAISTTDLTATAERLRDHGYHVSEPGAGSRVRPNGDVLGWKTMGLMEPIARFTPFLIQWDSASPHPAATSPGGCTLVSVQITEPSPEALSRLLEVLGIEAQVRPGTPAQMRVTVACPGGRVVFSP